MRKEGYVCAAANLISGNGLMMTGLTIGSMRTGLMMTSSAAVKKEKKTLAERKEKRTLARKERGSIMYAAVTAAEIGRFTHQNIL
ncbi:hypothetical protein AXI59_06935 [Bacillus nakamurai]|uniref:hypothetical protein n=1 Tax=Bacillus nakamurai TaxID=1793963 RepID=UPI000778416F|nr:hypothetical protein [Bacillus nakamurai]KXZ24040.1 hypothetical protein AXI59_06935 [Bacillus nakamurai]MCC9022548.1 hypothetical protein [Bacillus nakamurai]